MILSRATKCLGLAPVVKENYTKRQKYMTGVMEILGEDRVNNNSGENHVSISSKIVDDFVANGVDFITTVPCKQLAGVIDEVEAREEIFHIPSNKEDEGMGLCAGAFMGGKRPAIIMQNTAIGVTINTLATLTQFYRMPLPMLISYRGELREPVACQVEMAVHTKALLNQLQIPTYHFHKLVDANEMDAILKYTFMCNKPVAILTDASFWGGYGE
jgi:sulfopyruvate decarboxylase subunit alpha